MCELFSNLDFADYQTNWIYTEGINRPMPRLLTNIIDKSLVISLSYIALEKKRFL